MRVFVTGGTGFIGGAVVDELLASGHEVLALARTPRSASTLADRGAVPHTGALEDVAGLLRGADACEAVIHTAFDNASLPRMRSAARVERRALRAIGDVLAGTGRPLVAAGGFLPVRPRGALMIETVRARRGTGLTGRNVERTVVELAARGVNASVVRLPCVHGEGDTFTLPRIIDVARRRGRSAFVGAGTNRLPAVHHRDAATVFRLAAERAVPAARYHAVAEQGVAFGDIARVIGHRLDLPVVGLRRLGALRQFGSLAPYVSSDAPASSDWTRRELGWEPGGPCLLADLDRGEYFAPPGR